MSATSQEVRTKSQRLFPKVSLLLHITSPSWGNVSQDLLVEGERMIFGDGHWCSPRIVILCALLEECHWFISSERGYRNKVCPVDTVFAIYPMTLPKCQLPGNSIVCSCFISTASLTFFLSSETQIAISVPFHVTWKIQLCTLYAISLWGTLRVTSFPVQGKGTQITFSSCMCSVEHTAKLWGLQGKNYLAALLCPDSNKTTLPEPQLSPNPHQSHSKSLHPSPAWIFDFLNVYYFSSTMFPDFHLIYCSCQQLHSLLLAPNLSPNANFKKINIFPH